MRNTSESVVHGRCSIKAVKAGETWQARAFRGMHIASEIETADTREEAIDAVKKALDVAGADEQRVRAETGFPSVSAVVASLKDIRITDGQRAMLAAHLRAPDHILTMAQLAEEAGFDDYQGTDMQYAMLGRKLAEALEWEPPEHEAVGPIWTFALASRAGDGGHGSFKEDDMIEQWQWQLRPQLIEALRISSW